MATTCKLIAKNVLSSGATSITFDNIPSTYTDLLLVASVRSTRASNQQDYLQISFNSSTSNFSGRRLRGTGAAVVSELTTVREVSDLPASQATSNTFSNIEIIVPNYAGSTNKSFSATSAQEDNQTTAYLDAIAGLWSNTAAITSITLGSGNTANLAADSSFFLYGITKA